MYKTFDNYVLSSDKSLLQYDFIYEQLAKTYWANERPHEKTYKAIQNSFCIGVYEGDKQVAFARIVTDYTLVFYLADVVVGEAYRGKGIGKNIVQAINESDEFRSLVGVLGTKDAHGLYEQFAFERNTDRMMIRKPIENL